MATLLEVSLQTLSQDTNFAVEIAGARDLMRGWLEIIGDITVDEQELMDDPAGFVLYAYAIMINSQRTESSPGTKAALRRSRRAILSGL